MLIDIFILLLIDKKLYIILIFLDIEKFYFIINSLKKLNKSYIFC